MNKHKSLQFAFIVSLLIISTYAFSQDLIVTREGDSLNCKITKVKTDYIYFTFMHNDEIRNTLLPLYNVDQYQYNYFVTVQVPPYRLPVRQPYPHFRAALSGGWSNRTAKLSDDIPSEFRDYFEELKSGHQFSVDLSYYFSEHLGAGFKYNRYWSSNKINSVYMTLPDGTIRNGAMSDNIGIQFAGPFVSTRILNRNKRNSLNILFAVGYLGYKDIATLIDDYTITGNTMGVCWDIGYDIGISKNLAIGFQVSLTSGTLTEITATDGINTETIKLEKENYENISHVDLSIGLRVIL
ncbi:MAG: hypothetical protein JXB00_19010 [Bacteroidales bacterium]|nr:hypothetical protein [Bacteroidales bacterium]